MKTQLLLREYDPEPDDRYDPISEQDYHEMSHNLTQAEYGREREAQDEAALQVERDARDEALS